MTDASGNVTKLSDVEVTISKPRRILHFSDGVEEEFEEDEASVLQSAPQEVVVDPKTLQWGPWLSHQAWSSGEKVVSAIDYVGEGLANFFGITTPKYQIEIDEYERMREEKRKMEEEQAGWVPKNTDGEIPLVMTAPKKDVENLQVTEGHRTDTLSRWRNLFEAATFKFKQ